MTKLTYIEGVGEQYAEQLRAAGVRSTEDLLKKGATPQGRKELAAQTELPEKQLLKWINHCDLFRIRGVGSEYAELLEAAGVDTVPELAQRNAQSLHRKSLEVNLEKKLVRRVPTLQEVTAWVEQANSLEGVTQS